MKKRRITSLVLAVCMALCLLTVSGTAENVKIVWADDPDAALTAGNPTPLSGYFFTSLWGATTSDLDVQDLLHAYSPVRYDAGTGGFRFDRSVVRNAMALDSEDGSRTYLLVFYDDLLWSDGTRITAHDYAFSILFSMNPAIRETGGNPADYSWIDGAAEYLDGTNDTLAGLRIITDDMLQIRVKAEALPYFYELGRLMIRPYPASVIAPGILVKDDGNGAYLSGPLTAETIRETVLDPENGYLSHPTVVSGPYTLTDWERPTAKFRINEYYKGNEDGFLPRIGKITYTLAENDTMTGRLADGSLDLVNKVTYAEAIARAEKLGDKYASESYIRTGLTMLWFMEDSPLAQDPAVRKAVAYCFDRDGFISEYTGEYGVRVDGFYGIGQWMYRVATGAMATPVDKSKPIEEQQDAILTFAETTLNGLTLYSKDTKQAAALLEAAGWIMNEDGIRCRTAADGTTNELRLTLGLPESGDAGKALETYLIGNLAEIGAAVTLQPMKMEEIEKAYRGEASTVDMLYLGEDFSLMFNPELLAPVLAEEPADGSGDLTTAKRELYSLALEMVRTEPDNLAGFEQKWVALQERITETLPLVPVYSNTYFDFFSRKLHNYKIMDAVTLGEALVESYMSDIEKTP